jgi:hypothetical protein
MLGRFVAFHAIHGTELALSGHTPLQLRANFLRGPFFQGIGAGTQKEHANESEQAG